MYFYGVVPKGADPYKPSIKFEAESKDEALEYTKDVRAHGAVLLKYCGYKWITKANQTIYCIKQILK